MQPDVKDGRSGDDLDSEPPRLEFRLVVMCIRTPCRASVDGIGDESFLGESSLV